MWFFLRFLLLFVAPEIINQFSLAGTRNTRHWPEICFKKASSRGRSHNFCLLRLCFGLSLKSVTASLLLCECWTRALLSLYKNQNCSSKRESNKSARNGANLRFLQPTKYAFSWRCNTGNELVLGWWRSNDGGLHQLGNIVPANPARASASTHSISSSEHFGASFDAFFDSRVIGQLFYRSNEVIDSRRSNECSVQSKSSKTTQIKLPLTSFHPVLSLTT